MNFQQLRRALPHLDELRLCAGSARADGALVSAMALLRQGTRAVLCAVERVEEGSLEQPPLPRRATNRERILARCDSAAHDAWDGVAAVELGEAQYEIDEGNFDSLEEASTEDLLLLAEILRAGYVPHPEIEQENFSLLRLCAWQLAGEFDRLPEGELRALHTREGSVLHACREGAVDLPVGPCDGAACTYLDAATGERRTFWVHSVELVDLNPEREMPRDADPRAWASFQQDMERLCPRGMRVPAIVYEEEGNRQLDFFDAAHLDAVPEPRGLGGATSVAVLRSRGEAGPHGLPLRDALLQTPVPPDADRVRAEALRCFVPVPAQRIAFAEEKA